MLIPSSVSSLVTSASLPFLFSRKTETCLVYMAFSQANVPSRSSGDCQPQREADEDGAGPGSIRFASGAAC